MSSVQFSVPKGFFPAKKGLRLGDPLSPFLFVLVSEALSLMIEATSSAHLIKGFEVARNAPIVGHLQYENDTFIYSEDEPEQILNVKAILIYMKQSQALRLTSSKVRF